MKNITILLLTTLLILMNLNCGHKDSQEAGQDSPPQAVKSGQEQKKDSGDSLNNSGVNNNTAAGQSNRVILKLGEINVNHQEFMDFVKLRYSDPSVIQLNHSVASRILELYIEHRLLLRAMNSSNITIDREEIESFLKSKEMTPDKSDDKNIIENLKIQKFLYNTIYKDINVTDREIQTYFQQNLNAYKKEKEVLLHQIVLKDYDEAYQIRRTLLRFPEKYEKIAREKSIGREASNGGDMGYYEFGILPKDMEDVVFALELNEISPVVKSPYGFHIFKVTKIKKPRTLNFQDAKEIIRKEITGDKTRQAYLDYIAKLKREIQVDIKYDALGFTYKSLQGEETYENVQNP